MRYVEEHNRVPVTNECDVLICGGGIAGISAALAAARRGKKTILCENEFSLGGLATLGIVTIYLPICDGKGHQVIYGIGEELLRMSMKYGYEDKCPTPWLNGGTTEEKAKRRFEVQYNPCLFVLEAERLLLDAGVIIMYGTRVCAAHTEEGRIKEIIVENKSGRSAYSVGSVIDCTGDADVAKFACAKTATFSQGNILAAWYYRLENGRKKLIALGFCDATEDEKKNGKTVETLLDRRFTGLDGTELSELMQLSHGQTLENFRKVYAKDNTVEPTMLATIPQIRMTRRISGAYNLDTTDDKKFFEDSIGMTGNWKVSGTIYEVPFRTIKAEGVCNLLAAGRCISVTDNMWDVTRVIPTCAVTGEAAGVAAALTDNFDTIDTGKLQTELRRGGVRIHTSEIGL